MIFHFTVESGGLQPAEPLLVAIRQPVRLSDDGPWCAEILWHGAAEGVARVEGDTGGAAVVSAIRLMETRILAPFGDRVRER